MIPARSAFRAKALLVALCVGPTLWSQVPNDTCATAAAITGTLVSGTNVGATTGPDPTPGCQTINGDVWYSFVAPCSATYTASTCSALTNFSTIVAIWNATQGCVSPTKIACSDVCTAGVFQGSSATFTAVLGTQYFISVGGSFGAVGSFELSVTLGAAMNAFFFTGGIGTLGYAINEGPANGVAYMAVTLNAGQFPTGWFLGIDISWLELMYQLQVGYPFVTLLQPCGSTVVGPFGGLPAGLQFYGAAIALPQGGTVPVATTVPVVGVVL